MPPHLYYIYVVPPSDNNFPVVTINSPHLTEIVPRCDHLLQPFNVV